MIVIWTKLQCANYQYVQRWEFKADGSFEAGVGLGGRLWTTAAGVSNHIHNFYFRLDFDIARLRQQCGAAVRAPEQQPGHRRLDHAHHRGQAHRPSRHRHQVADRQQDAQAQRDAALLRTQSELGHGARQHFIQR